MIVAAPHIDRNNPAVQDPLGRAYPLRDHWPPPRSVSGNAVGRGGTKNEHSRKRQTPINLTRAGCKRQNRRLVRALPASGYAFGWSVRLRAFASRRLRALGTGATNFRSRNTEIADRVAANNTGASAVVPAWYAREDICKWTYAVPGTAVGTGITEVSMKRPGTNDIGTALPIENAASASWHLPRHVRSPVTLEDIAFKPWASTNLGRERSGARKPLSASRFVSSMKDKPTVAASLFVLARPLCWGFVIEWPSRLWARRNPSAALAWHHRTARC